MKLLRKTVQDCSLYWN